MSQDVIVPILLAYASDLERYIASQLPARLSLRVDPEDILQEVYTGAYRHRDQILLMNEDARLKYLLNLAKFKVRDAHKEYQRRCRSGGLGHDRQVYREGSVYQMLSSLAATESTPGSGIRRSEVANELDAVLRQLPEKRAEAIRRRYLEEKSVDTVAEEMRTTHTIVRNLLAQGLRQLRQIMAERRAASSNLRRPTG